MSRIANRLKLPEQLGKVLQTFLLASRLDSILSLSINGPRLVIALSRLKVVIGQIAQIDERKTTLAYSSRTGTQKHVGAYRLRSILFSLHNLLAFIAKRIRAGKLMVEFHHLIFCLQLLNFVVNFPRFESQGLSVLLRLRMRFHLFLLQVFYRCLFEFFAQVGNHFENDHIVFDLNLLGLMFDLVLKSNHDQVDEEEENHDGEYGFGHRIS